MILVSCESSDGNRTDSLCFVLSCKIDFILFLLLSIVFNEKLLVNQNSEVAAYSCVS